MMKTRFSAIVHLRKRDMQECERTIMQNENKIANKQMQIESIADEIVELKAPQYGTFYAFIAYNEVKQILFNRLSVAQNELEELLTHKAFLQTQYKQYHIEYEKMAFLDKREQEEILKAIKNREEKETDEIATLLYNNTEGRVI